MKKTTLLIIGVLVLVLQATAQVILYQEDFESQVWGATPQNWDGGNLWGGAGAGDNSFTVGYANDSRDPNNVLAAIITWTVIYPTDWSSFWSGGNTSLVPGFLNDPWTLTCSVDFAMTGATGNQPVTIWLEQDYNGGKMAASYTPTNGAFDVDGQWITVTFTLDQAIIQVGNEFSQWDMGQQININPCGGPNGGWGMNSGDVNIVKEDNFLLLGDMPIPEPGTIALLTFGGLGALVAIRRRRA